MATLYSITATAGIAHFPVNVTKIVGKPTSRKLIRVLNTHLIPCVQSHMTTVSPLNLLYICIPPTIYGQFTAHACPVAAVDPDPWDGEG